MFYLLRRRAPSGTRHDETCPWLTPEGIMAVSQRQQLTLTTYFSSSIFFVNVTPGDDNR
jgi:hypothetical protein